VVEAGHEAAVVGLNKRDAAGSGAAALRPVRGVIGRLTGAEFEHRRLLPIKALRERIEHFWWVRWHGADARRVSTLPHPCVHWSFEASGAALGGVHTRRWERQLDADGEGLEIKFLPAGFRAQWTRPMHTLVDTRLDAELLPELGFGRDLRERLFGVGAERTRPARFAAAVDCTQERLLEGLAPADPRAVKINAALLLASEDRRLLRAQDWAEVCGHSLRSWQRMLREMVGVGPKWILARYRLHEALQRLQQGEAEDLSAVAADYGYADAAHFSRVCRRVLGMSPSALRGTQGVR